MPLGNGALKLVQLCFKAQQEIGGELFHVGLHAIAKLFQVPGIIALLYHALERYGQDRLAQVQGLGHERVAAALYDIGAACQEAQKAVLALLHVDDIAVLPFFLPVAKHIACPLCGLFQEGNKLRAGGIALVHHDVPFIGGRCGKDLVTQNGRNNAGLVPLENRRLVEGDNEVGLRGPEKVLGRQSLQKGVPPHVARQVLVLAAGDDMLMAKAQAGQIAALGGPGHKILKIRHAHVRTEGMDKVAELPYILLPVPQKRQGAAYGRVKIDVVVPEDSAQVGNLMHWKFRRQDRNSVVCADKEKLMLLQPAGNGQAAHGVPMSCTVNAI